MSLLDDVPGLAPRRRLHADAAARRPPPASCTRRASDVLQLPGLLAVTTIARDQPPAARDLKFLHGGTYMAYAFVGDLPASCSWSASVGDRASLRAAPVPHPHQVQARARHDPGRAPAHRPHRLRHRGLPHRREGMPDYEKWSLHRLPARQAGRRHAGWLSAGTRSAGSARRELRRVPGDPAGHDAAPHVHLAAQHVPERARPPQGRHAAMPNLMETELESFGASTVEDFTWKQLLDTDACTMCGRCTSVCPAHATGKPLDPREIVLKTGEVMAATGTRPRPAADRHRRRDHHRRPARCSSGSPPRRSGPAPRARPATRSARSTSRSSTRSSTCAATCRSWSRTSPPSSAAPTAAWRTQGNPWGMSQTERADWTKVLDGITVILDGRRAARAEYLYWVGCAGSFDDKNKKVTQAMAKLMQRAGIDFAILGPARTAPATPPAARATSTSSRCSPCRTSRPSTAWACARSSRSARTASTR
jgi:ferredoxin